MRGAGPRTVREMRDGLSANRQALASAPQVIQRPAATATNPPAPGTLAFMEAERQRLRDAKDLRVDARSMVDRVFAQAQQWVKEQHGRHLSLNPLDARDPAEEFALRAAERAAERFVAVSLSPQTSQATREHALGIFTEAVAVWLGKATEGWETAQALAEREAREEAERWRR